MVSISISIPVSDLKILLLMIAGALRVLGLPVCRLLSF